MSRANRHVSGTTSSSVTDKPDELEQRGIVSVVHVVVGRGVVATGPHGGASDDLNFHATSTAWNGLRCLSRLRRLTSAAPEARL